MFICKLHSEYTLFYDKKMGRRAITAFSVGDGRLSLNQKYKPGQISYVGKGEFVAKLKVLLHY